MDPKAPQKAKWPPLRCVRPLAFTDETDWERSDLPHPMGGRTGTRTGPPSLCFVTLFLGYLLRFL